MSLLFTILGVAVISFIALFVLVVAVCLYGAGKISQAEGEDWRGR